MRIPYLAVVFVLLSLSTFGNFSIAQSQSVDILIIYSNQEERNTIAGFFSDYNVNIDYITTVDETPGSFSAYDLVIVADSEGEVEGEIRTSLEQYVARSSFKGLITISSKIDQFSGNLRRFIGVENFIKEVGDANSGWTFNITGSLVSYSGEIGLVSPTSDSIVLGRIISTNDTELVSEISGGEPIVIERNSTTYYSLGLLFDFSTSSETTKTSLQGWALSVFSDLLREKIREIMLQTYESIKLIVSNSNNKPVNTDSVSNSSFNSNPTEVLPIGIPSYNTPSPAIFAIIVLGLIGLFFQRIIGLVRWLSERTWVFLIFIISSIYQPENRQLSEAQLLINSARRAILDYLEFMGSSGAHLREIKNAIDIGMGNLLWHLEILEDYGWIEKRKIGRYNVYVASEFIPDFDENLKDAELKLRSKHAIALLEYLLSYENLEWNISSISKEIGVNRKSVRTMLRTLKKHNLIWNDPNHKEIMKINHESIERILDTLLKSAQFARKQNRSGVSIHRS